MIHRLGLTLVYCGRGRGGRSQDRLVAALRARSDPHLEVHISTLPSAQVIRVDVQCEFRDTEHQRAMLRNCGEALGEALFDGIAMDGWELAMLPPVLLGGVTGDPVFIVP